MSSYKYIAPIQLFSASVTGSIPVISKPLSIPTIKVAGFLISVAAGLTATFQLMVSMDGNTFYDSGEVINPAAGAATVIPFNSTYIGFPYVAIQISPSGGTGNVTIIGTAKT